MGLGMEGEGNAPAGIAAIFHSALRAECDERAFVLGAVGIPSVLAFDGERYVLGVAGDAAGAALAHLQSYERESAARAPVTPPPPQPVHPHADLGAFVYVVLLIAIAWAVSQGAWRVDDFERGALDAARVQGGEWWRAWTALTLHRDIAHLVGNLGGGALFGYLAARQLGAGLAWLLAVTGAAAANLFDAGLGPASYQSVGASTAVFTSLGLMAGHSWRTRWRLPQRWALRWAPLVGGVALLGLLGTEGAGTDVVAHAFGFAAGGLLGAWAAGATVARWLARVPQWASGALALASIAGAWALALRG